MRLTYHYNANGTVLDRHDHLAASFPEVFGYDELNRLKERRQQQPAGADLVDTFDYDALGNLTQMPGLGTYAFEPTRPQLVASAGSHQYHHDANGNLDSRSGPSVPGGSQTLAYNAFDMPKRITPGAGSAVPDVDLEYDGFQNRAVKRATDVCSEATCSSTTTYYAGGGYTQTRRVAGATTDVEHRYRVFAGGRAIAELVRDGAGASVANWYPHTDALGSPNVLIDDAGTRNPQFFAPFGQATPDVPVGDSGSQMGFTGHDHDAEVGLIDMNGRVYDPTLGRFLTADPYVQAPFWSQGLNRYAYVFNSPLNYTDPSGFSAIADYFQGLNDAPPEQAIPGYIGTALVAGLAAYAAYEAVSATISASASNAAATSIAESGGADAPAAGAPAAVYVATERFGRAMGSTKKTVSGKPPTHSLTTPTGGGQQSGTVQNRALKQMGNELGQVVIPVPKVRRLPPGAPPTAGNPYEDLAKALVKQWNKSQLRQDFETVGHGLRAAWDWLVRADNYTDKVGKVADQAGEQLGRRVTPQEVKDAIHRVKENLGRGGPVRNPDVMINPKTGDVRPKVPDAPDGMGDSIGNIFDFL